MNRNCTAVLFPLLAMLAGAPAAQAQGHPRPSGRECREGPSNKDAVRYCDPRDLLFGQANLPAPTKVPAAREAVVSFTTVAAPKQARKAHEKAVRELDHKRPDFAKAARYLEHAVTLYPRFAEAWQRLGETRFALNDFQRAEDAFRAALAADPKYPYPYLPFAEMELTLARIDLDSARLVEAARLAEQVLKLNPQLSLAHYYRAIANYALGNSSSSEQSIRAIIDNGEAGLYPGVYTLLAEMRATGGDLPSAVAEYRRFLELEPNSPVADEVRARLTEWQVEGRIR